MSDEQLVAIAKAYIEVLRFAANDPTLPLDDNLKRMIEKEDHCAGLVIGFVRGWRLCQENQSTPTLTPGSN